MEAPEYLANVAQILLDEVVLRFDTAGIALPERRFLHAGLPAHDCEQLSVSFVRIYNGSPGLEERGAIPCALMKTAEFEIEIVRCVPTLDDEGPIPTAGELTEASQALATDAFVLWQGLIEAYRDKSLPARLGTKMALGSVDTLTPSGGFGAIRLSVALQL